MWTIRQKFRYESEQRVYKSFCQHYKPVTVPLKYYYSTCKSEFTIIKPETVSVFIHIYLSLLKKSFFLQKVKMARESKMSRFKNSFKSPKKRHTHGLLDHPTKVKTSVKMVVKPIITG